MNNKDDIKKVINEEDFKFLEGGEEEDAD